MSGSGREPRPIEDKARPGVKRTLMRVTLSFVFVVLVAVAGAIITVRIADYQRDQYFEVRKFQAAAAAATLEAADVNALKGNGSDLESPAFKKLRSQLISIKKSDARIRFVYLMRPEGNRMIFLADAEPTESDQYSPPGQVYYEAKQPEFYAFQGKKKPDPWIMGPAKDRWGNWISASAYIVDATGKPVAVLGTDVGVDKALSSFNRIKEVGMLYVLLASLLLGVVLTQWIVWGYNRDSREAAHKAMDDSLMRLNDELIEADHLKSEFIEAASHELRSPVTTISLGVHLIEQNLPEDAPDRLRDPVVKTRKGAHRLVELVNDLLDVTRMQAGGLEIHREILDLGTVVNDAVELFRPLADSKKIEMAVELEGDMRVDLGAQEVKRILENLISNAIKYTDEGKVTVRAEAGPGKVLLAVSDTGRGIPERFTSEVFEKFSRMHLKTGSSERGTGLGLAITQGLAEAHGGRVRVDSKEGEGSTFYVELPQ